MRKTVFTLLAAASLLAGCADMGTKEGFGTMGGAVVGGLAGSRFGGGTGKLVAVGAGTLIGALLGSELGKSLDKADQTYADRAYNSAYSAPLNQTITWNNPQSGNSGTVTPLRDGYATNGAYCREYQQTITVGGRTRDAHGTACREPDGSWKIVN